ncbi:MAG: 2,3-bisphosphoglycerate-independent phosphoglycerate mutase [Thermodesulfobacteriota bacterium]
MSDPPKKRCLLLILDGWGIADPGEHNAVWVAKTPFLDGLKTEYPNTQLACAGKAVGLPEGIMGNSEVGHLNIGAGRVVYQALLRIDVAIEDGSFFDNPALVHAMEAVDRRGTALHLMGLVSDGGVHSQMTHLYALIDMAARFGLEKVYVHAILDGRDTPPDKGVTYISRLQQALDEKGVGQIATVCGRYYAMDRDKRWQRTELAYRLYTLAEGEAETDPVAAVKNAYARGETDEFVKPVVITAKDGHPRATVDDGDGVIFFNFRPDRVRQITRAFTAAEFDEFQRPKVPALADYVCMAPYDETFDLPVAFTPMQPENILGEVISNAGLRQLRLAETEKYAHVTYFFNGGREVPFAGEDRKLIPSPREVGTYDEKPEMSAHEVADEAVTRIEKNTYHLVVINFANLDMVGHTGSLEAAVKACEAVDTSAARVVSAALDNGYSVMVTADHGNAEQMDDAGGPHTAHTLNPVPFVLIDDRYGSRCVLREGVLGDIAPTVLDIMGIAQPPEMTCRTLIETE